MRTDVKRKKTDLEIDGRSDEKLRKCLMCGVRFMSSWAGNRICKKCRAKAHYRSA